MKVKVTTYIQPIVWDQQPNEVAIYDLKNQMQNRFFYRDMYNISQDELKIVEPYTEKEGKNYET